MAGLNLRAGGNASVFTGASNAGAPVTVQEAAFGSANGIGSAPTGSFMALSPTNPAGIAFWSGVAGLTFLLVLRHSLPR